MVVLLAGGVASPSLRWLGSRQAGFTLPELKFRLECGTRRLLAICPSGWNAPDPHLIEDLEEGVAWPDVGSKESLQDFMDLP